MRPRSYLSDLKGGVVDRPHVALLEREEPLSQAGMDRKIVLEVRNVHEHFALSRPSLRTGSIPLPSRHYFSPMRLKILLRSIDHVIVEDHCRTDGDPLDVGLRHEKELTLEEGTGRDLLGPVVLGLLVDLGPFLLLGSYLRR